MNSLCSWANIYLKTLNFFQSSITEAMSTLSNATISNFVIRNNIATAHQTPKIDLWSPWVQLGQDDGTNPEASQYTLYR